MSRTRGPGRRLGIDSMFPDFDAYRVPGSAPRSGWARTARRTAITGFMALGVIAAGVALGAPRRSRPASL